MKKFKIAVSLLLVLSFLLCLAGCKNNKADESTEASTTTTIADETEYSEGDYTEYSEGEDVNVTVTTTEGTTIPSPSTTNITTEPATTPPTTQKTEEITTSAPATTTPVNTSGVGSYTKSYGGYNQTVFYPNTVLASKATLPVITWANGTGFSFEIYKKLLENLAENGYIVVACDEKMSADGSAQITSLNFIIAENADSESVLYKKVNTKKLAAAGHSQGGRSSVNAAAKDNRIICAISFAGSNFVEEAELLNTPTLFFAGEKDLIVSAKRWIVPAYDAAKGPAVYVSLKNGSHITCCDNPEIYSDYAISWLDLWLKNDTSAKSIFKSGGELSKDSAWTGFKSKGL